MDIINAIILGIVEGVTEFLPISSTGHLILMEEALGFKDVQGVFTVVVQMGAIAAVVWYFWKDLLEKTIGFFKWQPDALRFWSLLVIATIPAGIIGLFFDSRMEKVTTAPVVAVALIIGGIILFVVDRKPVPKHDQHVQLETMTPKQAALIGLGQCFSIIPGVSRSGATIVAGLATGLNRPSATAFSFYLGLPVLTLAGLLKLVKYNDSLHQIPGGSIALIIGLAVAFLTAWAAVAWLLKYVAHHNFKAFAYYRIALGVLILTLTSCGLM